MRPQVLLVALAVLSVLAALPLAKGSEEEGGDLNASPWPCCDQCDFCLRSNPPKCKCLDISFQGCHPACRNCVKYRAVGSAHDPVYRCADTVTNYCERRCTSAAAASII